MVSAIPSRSCEAGFALGRGRERSASFAFTPARPSHEVFAPAIAGRVRVSFRLRRACALQGPRPRALSLHVPRDGTRSALLARRIFERFVRRQLELARPHLDARELSAHRVAATVPLLL